MCNRDTDKATAAGWGAEEGKQELAAEEAGADDAQGEATPAGAATPVEAAAAPVVEVEEEDNTQTYDEYLAAQAEKKFSLGLPAARVANEGVDASLIRGSVAHAKRGEDENTWFLGNQVSYFSVLRSSSPDPPTDESRF
jgi:plasminogen activator inhibitor 1 RNA-binding protein